MSENIFLQEMPATVAYFEVREFSNIVSSHGPMDLGVSLGRYYRHLEEGVLGSKGRVVKFVSGAVLVLFPSVSDADHAGRALTMVRGLLAEAPGWCKENQSHGLPAMEYTMGLATGSVLYGELGTDNLRAFDALGAPVTLATQLARLAGARGTSHLMAASTREATEQEITCIEVEGVDFAGSPVRLFRVLAQDELDPLGEHAGKD
jgi:adenylate cyclase